MPKKPKKSSKTLDKWIAMLKERGIDILANPSVADILAVVGELTLSEFEQMLLHARTRAYVEATLSLQGSAAAREADRQRTYERQAELRARKEESH